MATSKHTSERGAVALITAMIVSILLMITTAGMVSLTVKSMRQSTDGAQSTKAYYAAEGGLEEALLALKSDPNYKGNCTGADAAPSAASGAITCTKITQDSNELVGELAVDQAVQLDISSVQGLRSLKVEWGLPGTGQYDPSTVPNYYTTNGTGNFPTTAAVWPSSTAPAILEVGLIEYSSDPTFTIDNVRYYQKTVGPKSKTGNAADPDNSLDSYVYNSETSQDKPFISNCGNGGAYPCVVGAGGLRPAKGDKITNPIPKRYVLRLKTRYNGAKYRIIAQGDNNVQLSIPGVMYTVDVTARAGDTFRRIQTSFPKGEKPTALSGLDYVLYSDTNICKSFQVKGGAAVELDVGAGASCIPN